MPPLADVIDFLKRLAPLDLAEEWDNVGLLWGSSAGAAPRVMTCLTLTSEVAAEAVRRQASLIVTHHPVLFRAVRRLTADDPQGRMLLELARAGIAVYSPHTAYDNATEGINQQWAEALGLTDIEPLRIGTSSSRYTIVCFVPASHLSKVQAALWEAGAGVIGEYSCCGFHGTGQGTFLGSAQSNPTLGQAGRLEHVDEMRLEVNCARDRLMPALRSLRQAHPYEEPAFDVYPVEVPPASGSGRMGNLPPRLEEAAAPMTLRDVAGLVRAHCGTSQLQAAGDLERPVRRVAIVCGSGGDLLSDAIRRQCEVFVTGEATFHTVLRARESGLGLILTGHHASERPAMERLATRIAAAFPDIETWASEQERDPLVSLAE